MKMRDLAPETVITKLTGSTLYLVFKSQCKVELQIENTNCKYCGLFFEMLYYSTSNC